MKSFVSIDLKIFFYGADHEASGFLTYNEIESLLGEKHRTRAIGAVYC